MKKVFSKKALSVLLASSMLVGTTAGLTGCGSKKDSKEPITLDVYSQLANYSGLQTGWGAKVLLDKFNVKLNIIPEGNGVYDTRAESGDLGDIVIFGNDNTNYPNAVKAGLLYDWNEDDILKDYGQYIQKNMPDALKKNQELTKTITDGASDALYGFGMNVALSNEDHEQFFYTWDIRWDLYKKLGYPKVKNLDDYEKLLIDMQKLEPKDEAGNKKYAVSLWSQWDDAMVMYVKASATAYYGYDELGVGLYDPTTGKYHDALEENGPYLTMLKFYNKLYQDGLVDPDSMTQTYDNAIEKIKNGGTLCSIFNYSGSLAYNTPEHINDVKKGDKTEPGTYMYCLKPEEASPIVYGMNTQGGDRVWTIGAETEYPELCMEVINFFCTPEGYMTYNYGPKGVTWDYDKDKNTYFTDLGKKTNKNKDTKLGGDYEGSYHDGEFQFNNTTWSIDATNPESNGETYNYLNWKSTAKEQGTMIEEDWKNKTGSYSINEYMEKGNYTLSPGTSYSASTKDDKLKTTWSQVTNAIRTGSWNAIYAKTDAERDKIVKNMIKDATSYGYAE